MVLGGLGLAALGTAEALRPRRKLKLLTSGTIAEAIPERFGSWGAYAAELVGPEQAGRLAKTLYSEIVQRTYVDDETGAAVMLLVAYGDTQSDLLQLHRPESCYPAVGFNVTMSQPADVPIGNGATLPARHVVAMMDERTENIVYWTRMGEALPRSGGEQRDARLVNAMKGFVADGVLVRCSSVGDSAEQFRLLDAFVPKMLAASRKQSLPALVLAASIA
jgi:EpsI family protein